MDPLIVTAHLSTGTLAVFEDHSPALDSLLEWLLLDRLGLAAPNPTPSEVDASRPIVAEQMPLAQGSLLGDWYWQTSGPCYQVHGESTERFRKRWQPGVDTPEPAWGRRKPKVETSQGPEKSYDLPLYVRNTQAVHWYCVGDRAGIEDLLGGCTGLGKKRAYGYGQVNRWEVKPHEHDWHLWRDNILMRPVPAAAIDRTADFGILQWGWRPPAWLPANRVLCAMPVHTVSRVALASPGRPATR